MTSTRTTIYALILAAVALAGASTEANAWFKQFKGTQAQVVAACSGPGMDLQHHPSQGITSCMNTDNGNRVTCNDKGNCTGHGTGPMPRRVDSAPAIGTIFAAKPAGVVDPDFIERSGQSGFVHGEPEIKKEGSIG